MELTSMIGSLGFPIAVSVYLLVERGKTLKELITAINNLTLIIERKLN